MAPYLGVWCGTLCNFLAVPLTRGDSATGGWGVKMEVLRVLVGMVQVRQGSGVGGWVGWGALGGKVPAIMMPAAWAC